MSGRIVCFKRSILTGVALLCAATVAQAASGTWNGTADALWTNNLNWSAAPALFPSGNDTATFNNAGGVSTALDIAGLSGILNITFDTATAAAYTIGAGAANSQTLVMGNNGTYRMNSSVANGQTFNAAVQLGTSGDAGYTLLNDSAQTLTFNNVVATGNTKTLNINGSGNIAINGNLARGGGNINVILNNTSALTLSGLNSQINTLQINGAGAVINLAAGSKTTLNNGGSGNLMSAQNCTINGPGGIVLSTAGGEGGYADNAAETGTTLTINAPLLVSGDSGFEYWHNSYRGTIALLGDNSFTGQVLMNQPGTISCTNINNQGVNGNFGRGQKFIHNGAGSRLLFTGPDCTTDRIIELRQDGIVEQAGSGSLKFTTQINVTTGTKTLTLQGSTAGTGEFAGAIRNDAGVINLRKAGTGIWTLSADNTFSGTTAVNGGTLALSGALGATTASTGYSVTNSATLQLYNTSGANNTNRLRDASAITMSGGTLALANDGSAADYLENAGALTVAAGANTLAVTPSSLTSTLRLASLNRTGGTLNFSGAGLGESNQNRIFITGQATGLIGPWATVNGTGLAAYDSVRGVYDMNTAFVSDIAAKGPDSVITNDATVIARINLPGDTGPITLAGDFTNSILQVVQNTTTNAVVSMRYGSDTNKTLLTGGLSINAGKDSLTLGETSGDGFLAALAAGGSISLQNNEPTAALTINSPVVNNTSASSLAKYGPGTVMLTASNAYSGVTLIDEGALVFSGSVTQTLAGAINGNGSLIKQGSGQLTLAGGGNYAGLTTIKEGIVVAQNNAAFGSAVSGTVVEAGATLDVGGALGVDALNLGTELFTVSGSGVGGMGAIVNNSPRQQLQTFGKVTLAGDTSFGGVSRWDLRNNAATLNMNGYNLTKVGNNSVVLVATTVNPGAGSIDVTAGSFNIETDTRLNGSEANTMRVRSGATLAFWNLNNYANTTPWSLILDNLSRVINYSGAANQNVWNGPVSLNGTATLDSNGANMSFSGAMTNSGSIVKINGGTVYLTGSNNTYTGTSTVNGGTLYAKYPGALPGYGAGKVTINSGAMLLVHASDGVVGWSSEPIRDLANSTTFTTGTALLGIDTSLASLNYGYAFPALMGLAKLSTNALTFNTPGQSFYGQIRVNGGELNMSDISVNTTNLESYIAVNGGESARLTLAGNTVWSSILPAKNTWCPPLYIGNSGRGVLVVKDNVAFTNRFNVGQNGGSAGAVYQSGGNVVNWGGGTTDGRIGLNGYGYYELSGGALTFKGWSQIGVAPASVGIFKISGGSFTQLSDFDGTLGLSRGGTGVVYVTSGSLTISANDLWVGDPNENGTSGGFADFTMSGGKATISGSVKMADRANMKAMVNLNGGVLEANQIYRAVRTGSQVTVGFNGGTFRARTAGALFGTGTAAPDSVSLYAGGATFDTTNLTCTIGVPLLAPAGNGVTGISVASTPGYIGPPMVTIAGGGGTGATAVASFDSASGTLTGIQVTCPGFGYTSTPTVSLSGGGLTSAQPTATPSIGSSSSGGLTKLGSGSLALMATNTYAGATTISNGLLSVGAAGALPAGTDVNMAGGTLNMGGFSLTNRNVTVTGGAIINGSLASDSFTKTGNGVLTLAAPISSVAPLVISGGTVKLQGILPGLFEGVVPGAFELNTPNPNTAVQLTTVKANTTAGWADNTTAIYSGYLWNRATTNVTWSFAEQFDDSVRLIIDATTVLNNGGWSTPTVGTITLTPGAHSFEARFGQGGGGAGPNSGWTIGFGVDYLGLNTTVAGNYQALTDPGDGSLLTLTGAGSASNLIATASTIDLAAGSLLDLGGTFQALAGLSGSGTVSNGTVGVTGTLAPGGTNVVGTLTIAASSVLTGTLLVDVATDGTSDSLVVQGDLNLSALNLVVANPGQLSSSKQYTLVTCSGTRTGTFASITGPDSRWKVIYYGDGTVKLVYNSGTMIQFQ
jgi:autotransporter-associated beta strand protein